MEGPSRYPMSARALCTGGSSLTCSIRGVRAAFEVLIRHHLRIRADSLQVSGLTSPTAEVTCTTRTRTTAPSPECIIEVPRQDYRTPLQYLILSSTGHHPPASSLPPHRTPHNPVTIIYPQFMETSPILPMRSTLRLALFSMDLLRRVMWRSPGFRDTTIIHTITWTSTRPSSTKTEDQPWILLCHQEWPLVGVMSMMLLFLSMRDQRGIET